MSEELAAFSGTVRLFPLPNLVLFPHVVQPLHIFEPRYRQLTADALAGDRLMALVLLQPGWEADYAGGPSICSVGCIGKIVADQRLSDGRYNLLLAGLSRVRIAHELPQDKLYRLAEAELLDDQDLTTCDEERALRRAIAKLVTAWFPKKGATRQQFRKLLKSGLALGCLCDIVSFALPLDLAFKQELLEATDVARRAGLLAAYLEEKAPAQAPVAVADRPFPPEFSVN